MGRLRRRVLGTVAAGLLSLTLVSSAATAEDPLYLTWSEVLPGLTSGYDPTSTNECKAGKIQCVDKVIREMQRRYDDLACDHNAVFAVAYLRTTEEYKRAAETEGFFDDVGFVNHEDAVFARYYFEAYDAWAKGDSAAVPGVWQVAFDAAADQEVDTYTNALLGMNAHINRDLAFVLWEIGLVAPDGTSRKADHDKVNDFLNKVDVMPEIHAVLDFQAPDTVPPGYMSTIMSWREGAWRNAERLRMAENDPGELALVKQSIEDAATSAAMTLKTAGLYGPLGGAERDARNAWCGAHRWDWS